MKSWATVSFAMAVLIFMYPPEHYAFYPRCPVYEAFGLLCPGCGATRAASALLHGRIVEALHWNALFVAAVFAVGLYAVLVRARGWAWSRPPRWMTGLGVTAAVAFGVVRNIGL